MRRVLEQCAHTTSAQPHLSVLGTRATETTAKTTEGYLSCVVGKVFEYIVLEQATEACKECT